MMAATSSSSTTFCPMKESSSSSSLPGNRHPPDAPTSNCGCHHPLHNRWKTAASASGLADPQPPGAHSTQNGRLSMKTNDNCCSSVETHSLMQPPLLYHQEPAPLNKKPSRRLPKGHPDDDDAKDCDVAFGSGLELTSKPPKTCIQQPIGSRHVQGTTMPDPMMEAIVADASDHLNELVISHSSPSASHHYQSAVSNGFCSGTQYIEARDSFVTAKVSDGTASSIGCGTSDKISDPMEFRKSSSICRGSTGSDVTEESSLSNFSSSVNKPHKANDLHWEAIQAVRYQEGVLGPNHFRLLKRLGCGDIGSVYLSELSGTKNYFAMKVMDKAALASRKKLLRAQTEKEILQCLDHPFLPSLYTHFETDKLSCLVMEFCPGGDLHTLRQKQPWKRFSEQAARFYVAEVLLALEYLHMLGIIYRDLKPENVLVRDDGHIMLSDFDLSLRCAVCPTLVKSSNKDMGSSKNPGYCVQPSCIEPTCAIQPSCIQPSCFTPRFLMRKSNKGKKSRPREDVCNQVTPLPELVAEPTSARSMSFVGTHEYLAPEIIKGEGHGSAVDWWTFGIFLYELLFGKTPFKGPGNRATLFNVIGEPLKFPDSPTVSFAARDLIRGLLVKEPQHRLGYMRGATEVKQHPFFQSVNWALIRCTSPPEVPRPFENEFLKSNAVPTAPTGANVKGIDVKPSGKYLDMDFF